MGPDDDPSQPMETSGRRIPVFTANGGVRPAHTHFAANDAIAFEPPDASLQISMETSGRRIAVFAANEVLSCCRLHFFSL